MFWKLWGLLKNEEEGFTRRKNEDLCRIKTSKICQIQCDKEELGSLTVQWRYKFWKTNKTYLFQETYISSSFTVNTYILRT